MESNSEVLLRGVLEGAAAAGASVELVRLRQLRFSYCLACGWCHETGECRLADGMQGLYQSVEACNLLVVASPIQFATVSALTKAFVERFQCFWAAKYLLGRGCPPAPGRGWRAFLYLRWIVRSSSSVLLTYSRSWRRC